MVVPSGTNSATNRINAATRVIAVKIQNINSVTSAWQNYVTNAAQIEADTDFTFFTTLPAPVASALRYKVDGQTSPAPVIGNFSPASGNVGDSVVITGTNFGSALSVSFNGTATAYAVNSAGQNTAQVPANDTSGLISVKTASGTATSSSSFSIIGGAVVADLVISPPVMPAISPKAMRQTLTPSLSTMLVRPLRAAPPRSLTHFPPDSPRRPSAEPVGRRTLPH